MSTFHVSKLRVGSTVGTDLGGAGKVPGCRAPGASPGAMLTFSASQSKTDAAASAHHGGKHAVPTRGAGGILNEFPLRMLLHVTLVVSVSPLAARTC